MDADANAVATLNLRNDGVGSAGFGASSGVFPCDLASASPFWGRGACKPVTCDGAAFAATLRTKGNATGRVFSWTGWTLEWLDISWSCPESKMADFVSRLYALYPGMPLVRSLPILKTPVTSKMSKR